MITGTAPSWSIHLPTADETCVRLRLRRRGDRDPWPFTLAVTELGRLGAVAAGRFRSLGRGRGEPLLASQELVWCGCSLHLEVAAHPDGGEASLSLPCWDDMAASEATEADFWALVDALAAAVGATSGVLGDGEALDPARERGADDWRVAITRHPALLVPTGAVPDGCGWRADHYCDLPLSRLSVLLR